MEINKLREHFKSNCIKCFYLGNNKEIDLLQLNKGFRVELWKIGIDRSHATKLLSNEFKTLKSAIKFINLYGNDLKEVFQK